MSALAFVGCGDGVCWVCRVAVLGALECDKRRRGFVRCGDGVLGVCPRQGAEPACSARSGSGGVGFVRCETGAATACGRAGHSAWLC